MPHGQGQLLGQRCTQAPTFSPATLGQATLSLLPTHTPTPAATNHREAVNSKEELRIITQASYTGLGK